MSGEQDAGDSTEPARDPPDDIAIETASPSDRLNILRVLDAAMLETDPETVDAAIGTDDALAARFKRTDAVVGALVATHPEPGRIHVDAVAVRRARRDRGIGSALVAEAVRCAEQDPELDVVTAEFDAKLEGFYTDLEFELCEGSDPHDTDRLRGCRPVGASAGEETRTGERRR